MTENKRIILPPWLYSALISLVTALIVAWGMISASTAIFDIKTNRNELDIEKLQDTKVSKDEFKLIIERLDRIEEKIDKNGKRSDK